MDNERCSLGFIDDTSSNLNPPPPVTSGLLPIEGERKRKKVGSSNISAKKPNKQPDSVDILSSSLTEDDVIHLFKYANISFADYEFLVPSKEQRANKPPQGYISVYAKQIKAGFRFPIHDMIKRICNHIRVSPSQLVPNAHGMIVGFILCATLYEIPLTESYFFSLFKVRPSLVKGFFQFSPIKGKNFLDYKPSSCGPWKYKFFFLRRKENPWNCITEWRESISEPTPDDSLAEDAIIKGIRNHHFRITELRCKDILVSGGIEPGVPTPQSTFRHLMQKAALNKFKLLPEDEPSAHATMESGTPSEVNTILTSYTAFPSRPSVEQPLNHQQSLLTPTHTEIISTATTSPVRKHLPVLLEDNIPPNSLLCKENQNQEFGSCEGHMETTSTVQVSRHEIVDTEYVLKFRYDKLELEAQELSLESKYSKSRIEELEQELELSEARSLDYENKSYLANEALEKMMIRDRSRDSELAHAKSRIQELEAAEAKRANFEKKYYLFDEAAKNFEKGLEDIKLDSRTIHEKIVKDATEAAQILEKRIDDLKSDSERYRAQIANDVVEGFNILK